MKKEISASLYQTFLILCSKTPQHELNGFVTMVTYWVPTLPNVKGFSGHLSFWYWLIHRMQIWRTSQLAPRTSCMKERLERFWWFDSTSSEKSCFVVDLVLNLFPCPYAFLFSWIPPKESKSSIAEKVFFFLFTSEGKPKRLREGVHDHRRNCLIQVHT